PGSLRRQAQVRHLRPDLDLRDLRGNVDTRLRKVESGEYEAVMVAKAGLDRLGLSKRISEVLSPEVCMPAVGQGAIAVQCRLKDTEAGDLLAPLDDAETRTAIIAERALLGALQGGCQVPLGAWARVERGIGARTLCAWGDSRGDSSGLVRGPGRLCAARCSDCGD